jgi:hypothetical protein
VLFLRTPCIPVLICFFDLALVSLVGLDVVVCGSQRFYKKAAAFVLRAVAKHSPELSQNVVAAGALDPLVSCLSEFEPSVKEAAVWALSHIARHNSELAQGVVDAGAIAQLVLCLQEPELALRRISASALSELAKHSPEVRLVSRHELRSHHATWLQSRTRGAFVFSNPSLVFWPTSYVCVCVCMCLRLCLCVNAVGTCCG